MAWSSPITPVSGTVITVAWATASVVDPLLWLRTMTGGSDPPGSDYSITSTSTVGTTWTQKVTRSGDTMTGDLQVNRTGAAAPTTGYLILGNNGAYYVGFDGSQHVISTPQLQVLGGDIVMGTATAGLTLGASSGTKGRLYDSSGALTVLRTHNNAFGVYTSNLATQIFGADNAAAAPTFKGNAIFHAGNDTRIGVPLAAVVWFPTLADLTAAGASWTRHTAADGRLLVGAGTAGSPTLLNPQTFAEAQNYGTDWGHVHAAGTLTWGGGFTGTAADTVNVTPSGSTPVSAASHQNSIPGSIAVGGSSASTVLLPALRAGIWARRI